MADGWSCQKAKDLSTKFLIPVPNSVSHCLSQVTASLLLSFSPLQKGWLYFTRLYWASFMHSGIHHCYQRLTCLFLKQRKEDTVLIHIHTESKFLSRKPSEYFILLEVSGKRVCIAWKENSNALDVYIQIRNRVSPLPLAPFSFSVRSSVYTHNMASLYLGSSISSPVFSASPGCPCRTDLSTHTTHFLPLFQPY